MTRPRRRLEPATSWAVLALYVGMIFYLSSRPYRAPWGGFDHADKLSHLIEYGVLGFLSQRGARLTWPQPRRTGVLARMGLVLLGGLCIAGLDEALQSRVPGRVSSVTDLLADALGLALGLALNLRASLGEPRGQPSRPQARGER